MSGRQPWRNPFWLIMFVILSLGSLAFASIVSRDAVIRDFARLLPLTLIAASVASVATCIVLLITVYWIGRCQQLIFAAVRFCSVIVLVLILSISVAVQSYWITLIMIAAFAL